MSDPKCEICEKPAIYDNRWVCSVECQNKFLELQHEFDLYDMLGLIDKYETVDNIPANIRAKVNADFYKK